MKLGPIHVVKEATMAVMQSMIGRLTTELEKQKRVATGRPDPQILHSCIDARYAPLFEAAPDQDDERSRAAVRRIVGAYRRARAEYRSPAPGMWDYLEGRNAAPFVQALRRGDEDALLKQLRGMFRTNLVWGLGCVCAEVWNHFHHPAHHAAYQLPFTDILVALAEAVGALRVANPEQEPDQFARALDVDPAAVFEATERRTGFDLSFPLVGGIYGSVVNGRKTTIDCLTNGYTAARLRELGAQPKDRFAEIGGGYGCLAMLMHRAGYTQYTIYDLPWVNALQGYFLIMALPPNSVRLCGEETGTLAIEPGWRFAQIADRSVDYAINTNALPEMGAETARGYLRDIRRGVRKLFLSINHEARAAVLQYGPQHSVAEMVESLGGFRRLSRSRHWVRNGYVEEVYQPEAGFDSERISP